MLCPKCSAKLTVWPWYDGGWKGIYCEPCDRGWWSDIIASKVHKACKEAEDMVMAQSDFPQDASDTLHDMPPYLIGMDVTEALTYVKEGDWDIKFGSLLSKRSKPGAKGLIEIFEKQWTVYDVKITRY